MRFWLGGYTADSGGAATGIGVLHAGATDSALAGGDLGFAGVAAATASPSWVAAHPSLDVLYAAQEGAGTVQAFVRTGDEKFAPLARAADAGALVCHIAVAPDGSSLIASCWGDGRVVRFALDADGRLGPPQIAVAAQDPYGDPVLPAADEGFDLTALLRGAELPLFGQALASLGLGEAETETEPATLTTLPESPDSRASRAHQARFLPAGVVATTDMGYDLVRFWSASGSDGGALRETQRVVLPKGSGPRHTVWHPSGHLYVVTELSHEVFVLAPDAAARASERWRIVSGSPLAPGTIAGVDFAAEIALTRDAQFIVVGIRGSNTLASLRVRDGGTALTPVALVESGIAWPRHHVIERDTVLVAGQLSNEVASLGIDERTGVVGRVRRRVEVPSPTRLLADRPR